MSTLIWTAAVLLPVAPVIFVVVQKFLRFLGIVVGRHLRRRCKERIEILHTRVAAEIEDFNLQKARLDEEWEEVTHEKSESLREEPVGAIQNANWKGIVGFFHPFCNAGGGGERVLWCSIQATQQRWPKATCVVYTGDIDATKENILERVKDRFNIRLYAPKIVFIYVSTRHWILSSTWPHFTLLGQSIGSLIVAYEAFSLVVPDIFIDTMGYAFTLGLSKFLFPKMPTGAYVHYPTISTDMLDSLEEGGQGINAGAGTGNRGAMKRKYWHFFAWLYGLAGASIDVVMANSSWTGDHLKQLWGPGRSHRPGNWPMEVVFPPVAVEDITAKVDVSETSEKSRQPHLVYIAQFRPEKNHALIITAFAKFREESSIHSDGARLILIGSVRDDSDEKLVYSLRLLAHELNVKNSVDFVLNAPWPDILVRLRTGSIGVNGMWNEHFGIGVVEYQAAGLISVVHKSGGPFRDIVVDYEGQATGYHAETDEEFAAGFRQGLGLTTANALAMRRRARESAKRFSEKEFAEKWTKHMNQLIRLQTQS